MTREGLAHVEGEGPDSGDDPDRDGPGDGGHAEQ